MGRVAVKTWIFLLCLLFISLCFFCSFSQGGGDAGVARSVVFCSVGDNTNLTGI